MKYFRKLCGVVLVLLLMSCSYNRQFYIINASDQECTITVRLNMPVQDYESRDSLPYLDDPGIRIDNETRKHLTKRLGYKILDKYTLEVRFPSSSTMFLGGKSSNDPWPYNSITIKAGVREVVFSNQEILKKFEKAHIFSFVHYYVFE